MKRITIKDLARLLHLSTSTVSRALSDHPDISEETKNRVRAAATEFNYTTNLRASLFRKNRSGLIALILPEFNMFYTPGLVDGINSVIASTKYSLIVFLSNNNFEMEKEIIRQCLSWAVEGVLIALSKDTRDLSHLAPLKTSEIACVQFDKTLESDFFSTVTINNQEASRKAVSHLIAAGHTNILGIFGNPNYRISQDRIAGYAKAMEEHDLPLIKENIISVDNSSELDYILPPILNHNQKLSAIFTMSDELLARSFSHTLSLGLRVPDDIAMIAISDGIYPYMTFPKITHIKDAGYAMGSMACSFLLDKINRDDKMVPEQLLVPTELVVLGSV